MKSLTKLTFAVLVLTLVSCSSVRVATDYDINTDFSKYKTFAFYKKGIDEAPISDLDKKRIMRAIEFELKARGLTKSSSPDILVSLFTKSREKININDNNFGGFWYPWYYGANNIQVSSYTEGTLFIDLLDASKKELVWQGIGTGVLHTRSMEKKEERVREFVQKIMENYPPVMEK